MRKRGSKRLEIGRGAREAGQADDRHRRAAPAVAADVQLQAVGGADEDGGAVRHCGGYTMPELFRLAQIGLRGSPRVTRESLIAFYEPLEHVVGADTPPAWVHEQGREGSRGHSLSARWSGLLAILPGHDPQKLAPRRRCCAPTCEGLIVAALLALC